MPVVLLLGAACGDDAGRDERSAPAFSDHAVAFDALLDEHFEKNLALHPLDATEIGDYRYNDQYANSISAEHRAMQHELDSEVLARLAGIRRDSLDGQRQLSYDIFKLRLETSLAGESFPEHLVPENQFYSAASAFVELGSGAGLHPFVTVKDYEDFLQRIDGFGAYVDQAIENMREGMRQGVTQPKILMQKYQMQLQSQLVESAEDSSFWDPVRNMPQSFSAADRQRLSAAYKSAIENKLIPAYSRMANFMADEYLAAARDSIGLLDLPDGQAWYAYLVRKITTTDFTAEEIHQLGLREVERIHGEMLNVMQDIGFEGTLEEFFKFVNSDPQYFYSEPDQLIQGYRDMADDIASLAPALFETFPVTPFEVRPVEAFREQTASKGAYQSGLPDGSRPGIFYANTYMVGTRPKWDMQSLFLHEAIPGHHFQISLQMENTELPKFRRYYGFTAYVEGWGLYAESLGKELGVYADPLDYFGALNAELWRSIRLVTDTGIHAKGWTRQQVLDYMFANSATSETRAVAEAERFMAIPAQALAYKVGMLKIREIRSDAERQLGERFDVRAFHTEVLKDGPVPLSMLQDKIQAWVVAQQ